MAITPQQEAQMLREVSDYMRWSTDNGTFGDEWVTSAFNMSSMSTADFNDINAYLERVLAYIATLTPQDIP